MVTLPLIKEARIYNEEKTALKRNQDGRVEGLPLVRTPESQLAAEQSVTERHWNSPKKYPTCKDKGEAIMRW